MLYCCCSFFAFSDALRFNCSMRSDIPPAAGPLGVSEAAAEDSEVDPAVAEAFAAAAAAEDVEGAKCWFCCTSAIIVLKGSSSVSSV